MDEKQERAYVQGQRSVWANLLGQAVGALGPDRSSEGWRLERASAVAVLRDLCERFGDNDWGDDLHLGDVIDKHLGQHLDHLHQAADGDGG